VLLTEIGEHLDGVIADGVDSDAFTLEVFETALQLNELRTTEWSPAGAAVEDDQPFSVAPVLLEVDRTSGLIR